MERVQFYCTGAKHQQKKKMGKDKKKKEEKKTSLGMGQSVLWRLLIHLGALFLLTVCGFFVPGGISEPPSVGQPIILPKWF